MIIFDWSPRWQEYPKSKIKNYFRKLLSPYKMLISLHASWCQINNSDKLGPFCYFCEVKTLVSEDEIRVYGISYPVPLVCDVLLALQF